MTATPAVRSVRGDVIGQAFTSDGVLLGDVVSVTGTVEITPVEIPPLPELFEPPLAWTEEPPVGDPEAVMAAARALLVAHHHRTRLAWFDTHLTRSGTMRLVTADPAWQRAVWDALHPPVRWRRWLRRWFA